MGAAVRWTFGSVCDGCGFVCRIRDVRFRQAVDYRVRDGKAQRFQPLAALLDSVQPHPHKRFALVTFLFPWLRCVLALHTLVVPPSPVDATAMVMPAAATATATTRPASGAQPTATTAATNDHHDVL